MVTTRTLINAVAVCLLIAGAFFIFKKFHNPVRYIEFPVVLEKVKNNEVERVTIISKRYGKVMQQPQFQQVFHGRLKNGSYFKSVFPVNEKLLPYHVPYFDTFKEHDVVVDTEEYAV